MRKQVAFLLVLGVLVLKAHAGWSQHRVHRVAALWPELQADYVFKSTSFLFFRNHYRHVLEQDFNQMRPNGPLQYLERLQFRLGYEHIFNPYWSAGISESFAFERNRNILFNELFVRHTGAIGKFRLTEQASVEHLVRWPKNSNGRFRLRTDLDRAFQVGSIGLRPRASYELFFNIDYHPQVNPEVDTRQVDRTRFRLDCQLLLNDYFALSPYFIRQTDYFVVEPAFDENNNIIRAGGKQNHITPIWGLEMRFSFFESGHSFPRSLPFHK